MSVDYTRVIVGTDGSDTAQCAVYAAGAIAKALGVPVVVATSWYREHVDGYSEITGQHGGARGSSWATDTVVDAAATLRVAGHEDVRTATPEGGPADALLRMAEEHPGTLIVVGTVGLDNTAERIMGNIPHQLTHHAQSDVLLVSRRDCGPDVTWGSVAMATDGSKTASMAVAHGMAMAQALDATSVLLTVAPSLDKGDRALDASADLVGVTDERRVVVSKDVAAALTNAASDYDLLVIGNKGMSGPSRLLGSVSNSVTHDLPTDLLLVNTTR